MSFRTVDQADCYACRVVKMRVAGGAVDSSPTDNDDGSFFRRRTKNCCSQFMLTTLPNLATIHVVSMLCSMQMTFYYCRLQSVSYKMSCIYVNVNLMLYLTINVKKSCCLRTGARNNVVCKPLYSICLLYTSPSPRDGLLSRMPSSA